MPNFFQKLGSLFLKQALPETLPLPQSINLEIGRPGGTKTSVMIAPVQTFNPYLAIEVGSTDITGQMFAGLVTYSLTTLEIVPQLAESWEVSPDQCSYCFVLRQDLHWSDGKPLTTEDIAFTFEEVINKLGDLNNYRNHFLIADQFPVIEVLDLYRIKFTISKPFAPFLSNLNFPILPKHVFEGKTGSVNGSSLFHSMWGKDCHPDELVVCGPWKLGQYTDQGLELTPNPYYHGRDAHGQRLPYLEKLIYLYPQDFDSEMKAFNQGEVDAVRMNKNLLSHVTRKDVKIYELGANLGSMALAFNQSLARNQAGDPVVDPIKSAWFRNLNFRRALAYAIDKDRLIQDLYQGHALKQISPICPQNPFYNPATPAYKYNLTKAQVLLAKEGFHKGDDSCLRDPDGHRVIFRLTTLSEAGGMNPWICSYLAQDWSQLGIYMEFFSKTTEEFQTIATESLDWDVMMFGTTRSGIDPHSGYNAWSLSGRMHLFNMGHLSYWQGTQPTNHLDWEIELDKLYQDAASCLDFEKRRALYFRIQELVSQYLPEIYLINPLSLVAVSNKLGNVFPSIYGGSNLNVINWNTEEQFERIRFSEDVNQYSAM